VPPTPAMTPSEDRTIRAETVIAEVEARWGATCGGCSVALIGHDVVLSILMGLRQAPRCIACLAASVGDELEPFTRRAHSNVRRLDCYGAGWRHSDRRLAAQGVWPEERVPAALRLDGTAHPAAQCGPAEAQHEPHDVAREDGERAGAGAFVAALFDAGDMGCGDLVLELRARLMDLAPGEVLEVRATDPGAPGDLPAWCRVTRHTLVRSAHPRYWIQRRADA
jgi:tRNA 2-thiouridine synthesizing protein A